MSRLFSIAVLLLLVVALLSAQSPWTQQTSPTTQRIRCIKAVDSQVLWACGASGAVLRTVNGGNTWVLKTAPNTSYILYSMDAIDSTTAWVFGTDASVTATGPVKIWKTTDGGVTWVEKYQNADSFSDGIRFFDANNGVAHGDPLSTRKSIFLILTTSDGGETWNKVPEANIPPVDSAADEVGVGNAIDVIGNSVWFVTYGNSTDMPIRVMKSTDKGTTWTISPFVPMNNSYGFSMKDANSGIICNYNGMIGRTTTGWATSDTATLFGATYGFRAVECIPGTNAVVLVGGPSTAGFSAISTDGGVNWTQQPLPAGIQRLYAVTFLNPSTGWAAGNGGGIIKWTGAPIVGVEQESAPLPEAFSLEQNYPNPFNPVTNIQFSLAKDGNVELMVHDILGRAVATLVSGHQSAGTRTVQFDAAGLPSGVYLYTLRAGDFTSTRSLVVLK
jgi:photosystem II stability/assembly factor-like uncharacterized protein